MAVLAVFVLVTAVTSVGVYAQEDPGDVQERGAAGFRISPTRDDLVIERGSSETRELTVRNVTTSTQTAVPVVDDFGPADDESGSPKLLIGDLERDDNPFSIKPFVSVLETVSLEPGEEATLPVTYTVPDDAAPGSYYGVIRFLAETETGEFDGDAAVTLNASVGMVVLIDVPGETLDLVELEEATALKDGEASSLFSSAPDSFIFRLANRGNTFQAPFGKVTVENWSGDVVYEYEINDTQPRGNILPDSIRRFEQELENIGSFGRFTVEANISYGDGGNIITSTTTFWVIPWTQILIGAVVLVVVIVGGTKGIKAYNKRVVSNSRGGSRVKKK